MHHREKHVRSLSSCSDSSADLQPCKQIPPGIRSAPGPFFPSLRTSRTQFSITKGLGSHHTCRGHPCSCSSPAHRASAPSAATKPQTLALAGLCHCLHSSPTANPWKPGLRKPLLIDFMPASFHHLFARRSLTARWIQNNLLLDYPRKANSQQLSRKHFWLSLAVALTPA